MEDNFQTLPYTPPPLRYASRLNRNSVDTTKQDLGFGPQISPLSSTTELTTPSPSPRTPSNGVLLLPRIRRFEESNCTPPAETSWNTPKKRYESFPRVRNNPYLTPPHHAQSPPYPRSAIGRTASGASTLYIYKPRVPRYAPDTEMQYPLAKRRMIEAQVPRSISFSAMTDCIGSLDANYSVPSPLPSSTVPCLPQLPPVLPYRLASELLFDSYTETPPSATLLEYLTAPNPSPSLVQRPAVPNRATDLHFWWDVRNIRTWTDFNINTVNGISGLRDLLYLDVPAPALPAPSQINLCPDTTSALLDSYANYYPVKVNAALKLTLGEPHMTMCAHKASNMPGARQRPDFTSSYGPPLCSDTIEEDTAHATHIVGFVRPFDHWNTGMRDGLCAAQIAYFRELAHLQHHMRSHGCRYGFIMTEIELVCVRLTTRDDTQPLFGVIEVASAVQLAKHSVSTVASKNGSMTACMALWYLHMLAKKSPLPGQLGWQVDVGSPGQRSRRHCLPRDSCMEAMKPEAKEKRDATRNRGWVWPEDALSRKECGRTRQWKREGTPATLAKESTSIR